MTPDKIILPKQFSIKKPNFTTVVARYLPVRFSFPDSMRIEPLSVPRLSRVIIKYQGRTLNSQKPTKWNQIFLDKMLPRLKIHRTVQEQRFFSHFHPLAAQ